MSTTASFDSAPSAEPIAIYHEHPDWFRPLFAELERRDIPYVRLDAAAHSYDPSERTVPYSLVFNRARRRICAAMRRRRSTRCTGSSISSGSALPS